jgi:hypothetical protein
MLDFVDKISIDNLSHTTRNVKTIDSWLEENSYLFE